MTLPQIKVLSDAARKRVFAQRAEFILDTAVAQHAKDSARKDFIETLENLSGGR